MIENVVEGSREHTQYIVDQVERELLRVFYIANTVSSVVYRATLL